MNKKVIFTGLRSNDNLQIGNYFGALMPIVQMAKNHSDEYKVCLMMADLHSINVPIDFSTLQTNIIKNLEAFVAAGLPLDNENVFVFRQSRVPAHSELAYLLSCFSGIGELSRMTEYKDKSAKIGNDRVSAGLFNYPPLMAADILLYGARLIPVGDDQRQHLEYTRDIATRINNKFGKDKELLVVPLEVKKQHEFFGKGQALRIKDLVDPTKKMSKSDETGKGVIFLNDEPEAAAKKIMSATTDSIGEINYDPENQPGISNLLHLHALLSGSSLDESIARYKGQSQYGQLKSDVADAVKEFLADFQTKLKKVDQDLLMGRLKESENEMNKTANDTLKKVQTAIGLR